MESRYESYSINKYNIEIHNDLMDCRVFWARVISSENESLFTQYTKHSFYEIQYALEGRIRMLVDEERHIDFAQSDFLIIPPETYHQIVDGDTEGARFIMAFTISPKTEEIANAMARIDELRPYHESEYMRTLLSMIVTKKYRDTELCKRQITTFIESFFMEMFEIVISESGSYGVDVGQDSEAVQRVRKISAFIHQYNGIGIKVSDLSERFNICERHLGRLFLSVVGMTPKEVINMEKRKHIEGLVATTKLSLSEISELCGFSDEYAMNKFFKRYSRTNLSDFRRISYRKGE